MKVFHQSPVLSSLRDNCKFATFEQFCERCKTEHALADGQILNTVPMSYDDLYGLYTGLLAGLVDDCFCKRSWLNIDRGVLCSSQLGVH